MIELLPPFLKKQGRVNLGVFSKFNPWETCPGFTCHYSLNVYVGCSHDCLYCYARSYISRIHKEFEKARCKEDYRERIRRDVKRLSKYIKLPVLISNSTDPYQSIEASLRNTRYSLNLLREYGFPVLINTKSELVVRDSDLLCSMDSAVALTITTIDDFKASVLEANSPPPSKRLRAVSELISRGVKVIVRVDPLIPGWNTELEELEELLGELASLGVKQVTASIVKLRRDFKRRIIQKLNSSREFRGELVKVLEYLKYFNEWSSGYYLLDEELRIEFLKLFSKVCSKHGLEYGFCMESYPFKAESCSGVHLLNSWSRIKKKLYEIYALKARAYGDSYSLKQLKMFKEFIKAK